MTITITITTFTGRVVDLLDPKPDTICLEDIARGLAMQCRFNGHIRRFYSVAEHSWRVAQHLLHGLDAQGGSGMIRSPDDLDLGRRGLMHDAAEAYVGDLIGPMKRALRQMGAPFAPEVLRVHTVSNFDLIEEGLLIAIGRRFGVTLWPMPALVKQADKHLYEVECTQLRGPKPSLGDNLDFGWDWARAEDRFLRGAEELGIR